MNETAKLFLIGGLCLALGAGGVLAWSRFSLTEQENLKLKAELGATAQPSPKAASPTPVAEKPAAATTGSITGSLGYPAEGIPPLDVYAIKQGYNSTSFKVVTPKNQTMFTIPDLPPGEYVVVAYSQDNPTFAGGYTKAVACGLSVDCKDHSLVLVTVSAGQTTTKVDVKDWYAPEGTFPLKPQ